MAPQATARTAHSAAVRAAQRRSSPHGRGGRVGVGRDQGGVDGRHGRSRPARRGDVVGQLVGGGRRRRGATGGRHRGGSARSAGAVRVEAGERTPAGAARHASHRRPSRRRWRRPRRRRRRSRPRSASRAHRPRSRRAGTCEASDAPMNVEQSGEVRVVGRDARADPAAAASRSAAMRLATAAAAVAGAGVEADGDGGEADPPRASRCCACWSRMRLSRAVASSSRPGAVASDGVVGATSAASSAATSPARSAGRRAGGGGRRRRARTSRCRRPGGRRAPAGPGRGGPRGA